MLHTISLAHFSLTSTRSWAVNSWIARVRLKAENGPVATGAGVVRFGAVGKYGSIAVVERLIRSIKNECTRRLLVPYQRHAFRRELALYVDWYNHSSHYPFVLCA